MKKRGKIEYNTSKTTRRELIKKLAEKDKIIAALECQVSLLNENTIQMQQINEEAFSLRKIIAHLPGNIYWQDREGRYLGCNNNLLKILQLNSIDDIVGKTNTNLLGSAAAKIEKANQEIISTGIETSIEERGYSTDKKRAVYLTRKIPLRNIKGEIIGLLGVSFDISERKQMEKKLKIAKEKAESANRAKSQFLAVVNHELRTPLTSILGLANFLKQKNSKAEQEKLLNDLEVCSQNLLSLVNEVLDFTQLEAGKYHLNMKPTDLRTLFHDVSSILTTLAKNKKIALHFDLAHDQTQPIFTDPLILQQIIINIASNAIKFTDQGQVTIQTRQLSQTNDQIQLEISIIDTGKGIPQESLGLIFEPFQQLEGAYTRQSSHSGTGLGLTIVKKLAQLVGLQIHASSEVGKGSHFSLLGEFKKVGENKVIPQETKVHSLIIFNGEKKPRILLVEDDRIIQRIHKKMFLELGCDIDIAGCGHNTLQTLQNHDMVFVDIGLPDISGFDLIRLLRLREDINPRLPIIALTVYNGEEQKTACLEAGANEVANKPISLQSLSDIIQRYWDNRPLA